MPLTQLGPIDPPKSLASEGAKVTGQSRAVVSVRGRRCGREKPIPLPGHGDRPGLELGVEAVNQLVAADGIDQARIANKITTSL